MEAQDRWAYYAKKPDFTKCEDDTRVLWWAALKKGFKPEKIKYEKKQKFFLVQQSCGICK